MEQAKVLRAALAATIAEGELKKRLKIESFLADNPAVVQRVSHVLSNAVLEAAKNGEPTASVVLYDADENVVAAEFLRQTGLEYTFMSRTSHDIAKYPNLSGFALNIKITKPKEL